MQTVQIDIVSDVACPWCAIGYKRLEQAMAELEGQLAFTVQWHAFRLNPDMPPEGEPILEHLSRKYGRSVADIRVAQEQIMAIAHDLGLNFSKAQERRAHNTTDAHRLLIWARGQGRQTELSLALFDAYFGHACDPSDPEVLCQVAELAGLSGEAARDILNSDCYAEAVETEEARFKQAGISGVPAFIINEHYLVSGAQEPRDLVVTLKEAAAEAAR